jgi:hypothetical protein
LAGDAPERGRAFERAGVDRLFTVAPSRDAAFAELEGD